MSIQFILSQLKGLINYFNKMATKREEDEGLVTFERRHIPDSQLPNWETCERVISGSLHLDSVGNVFEEGHGMLQASKHYPGIPFSTISAGNT